MSTAGGYYEALSAQVSFRLLRGDSWDSIQSWFRREYSSFPLATLEAVREQAELEAETGEKYRELQTGEQFGLLLPPGADIFEEHSFYLNVGVPIQGGQSTWITVRVTATATMTKAEIEQQAIATAIAAVEEKYGDYDIIDTELEAPEVNLVRGLRL